MMLSSIAARSSAALLAQRPAALATTVPSIRNFSDAAAAPKRKAKKVKKKEKGGQAETGRSRDLSVILAALDAPYSTPPPADAEEMERRKNVLKAYTVGKFKEHNEMEHDLSCKIKMKEHAIKMLPRNSELKEMALEIDWTGPPRWRRVPSWTPPIPNFDPKDFITQEE